MPCALDFFAVRTKLCKDLQDLRNLPQMKERGEGAMTADHLLILMLDELAAYLKMGKRILYRLAAKRKIPAFKVGGMAISER